MGLFDYVKVERDLPGGVDGRGRLFQTKDFDEPFMQTYEVTEDGGLIRHGWRFTGETIPKEERPFPDAEPGTIQDACGSLKTESWDETVDFDGPLRFYDFSKPNFQGDWLEFEARFEGGRLVDISAVDDEALVGGGGAT